MKKFFKEFKTFISRGNIVDMAIGVIIGGAFSAIVTALTNQIIMPLINALLSLINGTEGLEGAITMLRPAYDELGNLVLANSIYIDWGAFITAILNFFIIAFTLFVIIKTINASKKYLDDVSAMSKKENKELRKTLKQKAKEENRKYKEVKAEYDAELAAKAKEEAEAKAAAEKLAHPGEEALLMEIRNLLLANKNTEQKVADTSITTDTKLTKSKKQVKK